MPRDTLRVRRVVPGVKLDKSEAVEMVDHPKHYNSGSIEVIDVIEDWKLGFSDGNCVKYVGRAQHKGSEIQDIEKGVWYLVRHLNKLIKARAKLTGEKPVLIKIVKG